MSNGQTKTKFKQFLKHSNENTVFVFENEVVSSFWTILINECVCCVCAYVKYSLVGLSQEAHAQENWDD
jgi:hypothetical protein